MSIKNKLSNRLADPEKTMASYYFGKLCLSNQDSDWDGNTNNYKYFETKDKLICDIVDHFLIDFLIEYMWETPPMFFGTTDKTWEIYFGNNPIKTLHDFQVFYRKFPEESGSLSIRIDKITMGK
jgi:hypothetical protein